MKPNRIKLTLLFLASILIHVVLMNYIQEKTLQINCFPYDIALNNLRCHNVSGSLVSLFWDDAESNINSYTELLTMYFGTDCTIEDTEILKKNIAFAKKYDSSDFNEIKSYVYSLWNDLNRFPVGVVSGNPYATVTFSDSWMNNRTYGGSRGHEGVDIMATVNERGIYPIYSISDGIIENKGWLKLGGWRIGIRSTSGAYFYYAHLQEYAKDFNIGDHVKAGTLLGFMGDSGYSDTPGTYGNFPVHLHIGMYLDDKNGKAFSINSYPMLEYLWNNSK